MDPETVLLAGEFRPDRPPNNASTASETHHITLSAVLDYWSFQREAVVWSLSLGFSVSVSIKMSPVFFPWTTTNNCITVVCCFTVYNTIVSIMCHIRNSIVQEMPLVTQSTMTQCEKEKCFTYLNFPLNFPQFYLTILAVCCSIINPSFNFYSAILMPLESIDGCLVATIIS